MVGEIQRQGVLISIRDVVLYKSITVTAIAASVPIPPEFYAASLPFLLVFCHAELDKAISLESEIETMKLGLNSESIRF